MKYLIIILLSLSSLYANDKDSVICFEKKDVLILANKIQSLKDSINYLKDIVKAQDTLVELQKVRMEFYNQQLYNRNDVIAACEKRGKELEKINQELQPKWYDNKFLWFLNGVATVVAIVLAVK